MKASRPSVALPAFSVLIGLALCASAFRFPGEVPDPPLTTRPGAANALRIPLSGGLLHASGFFFNATVGGQRFTLQVDTTYSSLIIPYKTCDGCRIGDRRYDPEKSSGVKRIGCGDRRCHSPLDGECSASRCYNCSPRGRCCVEGSPKDCAFNVGYGDGSSGNGTLYQDVLAIGNTSTTVLFGAMHEESHNFELPYADGVFGFAFQHGACRPTCLPPLMDVFVNETGLANVFTMCVTRYGGMLVIGAADESLATGEYAYVDIEGESRDDRYVVPALSSWKVDDHEVKLPGITRAVWSVSISHIGVSKTSFLALLQTLMTYYCDVPGLCSLESWFRPQHCAPIPDSSLQKLPNITIPFTNRVSITLTPDDYLLPYRVIQGSLYRCVAFVVSDSLAAKGIGLLLGTTVMRRYAVAHDRAARRVGVALARGAPACGPANGSDEGLPSAPGATGNLLTADAPEANVAPGQASTPKQQFLGQEETCRALRSCEDCASNGNCSYSYQSGNCIPSADAGSQPYPFCSGIGCACFAVGQAGWYFGIVVGIVFSVALAFGVIACCKKRQQPNIYQPVNAYDEQDLETF